MATSDHSQLTYAFSRERGLVVLEADEAGVRLGLRDGADPLALVEARRALGAPIRVEGLSPAEFDRRLSEVFAADGLGADDINEGVGGDDDLSSLLEGIGPAADLLDTDDNAPVVRLINGLIAEAVRTKASDVHIEPYEDRLAVRFRVDGILQERLSHTRKIAPLIVSRVKVMARLDIAEKRVPQDGRLSLAFGGRNIDVRVSTLPSRFGERVVLRLLDKDHAHLTLEDLGFDSATLAAFKKALAQPNGVILVTGPTGSGKTTTLYSALSLLNDQTRNILTVEDPIEYGLDGVGQTQVNAKVGMTFASGLRAILRQDPDIVMVGEIRDAETAQIAVQAALTGHLVLSTVHTNSAAAAVTRLRDMGVEPFLLSSTVNAVLAQRLVRRLCETCKTPYAPDAAELRLLELPGELEATFHKAVGCPACGGSGYRGRVGIYELIVFNDDLRGLVHDDAREADLAARAFRNSDTLLRNGARQVLAGLTTSAEVVRTCRQTGEDDGGV